MQLGAALSDKIYIRFRLHTCIQFKYVNDVHVQYASKKSLHTFENNVVATLRPFIKQQSMCCNNNAHCCKNGVVVVILFSKSRIVIH